MAKKKAAKGVSNPHLHARISYLYQAANYLSQQGQPAASGHWELPKQQEAQLDKSLKADNEANDTQPSNTFNKERDPRGLSRHLITHMRAASLKTQIRLSRQVKRSLCKRCDSLLVPGHTAQFSIENLSKGGKKPWADTSVIECTTCGAKKRIPVGSKRQPKGRPKKTLALDRSKGKASLHDTPEDLV